MGWDKKAVLKQNGLESLIKKDKTGKLNSFKNEARLSKLRKTSISIHSDKEENNNH